MPTTNNPITAGEPLSPIDTSGSVPPPSAPPPPATAPAPTARSAPEPTFADPDQGEGSDRPGLAEAEALARIAAIAAEGRQADGPSRAIVGTAITLGVLVAALVVLALALSV